MSAESTKAELVARLAEARRLKSWGSVTLLESELRERWPARVELAQDSYYYGTAADFSTPSEDAR